MRISAIPLSLLLSSALSISTGASAEGNPSGTGFAPPEAGGPRRLEVTAEGAQLHRAPAEDSEERAALPGGTLLSNRGCDAAQGGVVWCEVAPLDMGKPGYVRAAQLAPARGPDGVIPTGRDDSKKRARAKDYDDRSEIACAQEQGQALGTCAAAIARSGGGDATVVATFPNGFARQLYFTHGAFMRGSSTMSGVGTDMDWERAEGMYVIRVDDQRFVIPQGFLLGEEAGVLE
ncbi:MULTISPECIES: hypothetical protein [unclassified Sulfitobacter]|uniref:hypothetical protein n=1 Tax=unclassified Sulfitobacter TaxID=196795 RepID=UPI0007C3EC6E|nr:MULTISPECIES: hypothetical protein [unclassified Sulfitobacter]KZY24317.1 hypothetical protein A3728_00375 [Sulfitobacter sp. HI0040]KZZ70338.1 hypothetical protein A3764_07840 [Sulfitobacter sp. HI0129]